jgi:hypothetical protein
VKRVGTAGTSREAFARFLVASELVCIDLESHGGSNETASLFCGTFVILHRSISLHLPELHDHCERQDALLYGVLWGH